MALVLSPLIHLTIAVSIMNVFIICIEIYLIISDLELYVCMNKETLC